MKNTLKLALIIFIISLIVLCINGEKDTKKPTTGKALAARKPPTATNKPEAKSKKDQTVAEKFAAFKKKYNKAYATKQEETEAQKNFAENEKKDEDHNKNKTNSYKRGTNAYSDKNHAWKVNNRMGAKKTRSPSAKSRASVSRSSGSLSARMGDVSEIPDSANWTDWNSPVKDQADCGSCWVYAATAVLEYLLIVIRENLTALSEQEILDCNTVDSGCDGGWPTDSFNYVIKNGLTSQTSYPYVSYQSDCYSKRFQRVVYINDTYEMELYGDEEELKSTIYNYGPAVVVIYASDGFTQYAGGVFSEENCPNEPDSYNHAITVVGYGTDPQAGDFWIFKNSWGKDWGEFGYGRIARNKGNMCGIANYAMMPSSSWISTLNFTKSTNQ